jgi:hypothetical protein
MDRMEVGANRSTTRGCTLNTAIVAVLLFTTCGGYTDGVISSYFTPLRCVFGHISRGEAE